MDDFTEELVPLTRERLDGIIKLAEHRGALITVSPVFYEDAAILARDNATPLHLAGTMMPAIGPEVVVDYTLPGSLWRLDPR